MSASTKSVAEMPPILGPRSSIGWNALQPGAVQPLPGVVQAGCTDAAAAHGAPGVEVLLARRAAARVRGEAYAAQLRCVRAARHQGPSRPAPEPQRLGRAPQTPNVSAVAIEMLVAHASWRALGLIEAIM